MLKKIIEPSDALPGRAEACQFDPCHFIHGRSIVGPFAEDVETIVFGMGCFWGAEKKFWDLNGVATTAVGYAAGITPNPRYAEVCSGMTGHAEVVFLAYIPEEISFEALLKVFWESHDPTQGMRQGNDLGSQYRSGIYTSSKSQLALAESSLQAYQQALTLAGHLQTITTEVAPLTVFYYAEEAHQQYLGKNPNGYCGLSGTGVALSI